MVEKCIDQQAQTKLCKILNSIAIVAFIAHCFSSGVGYYSSCSIAVTLKNETIIIFIKLGHPLYCLKILYVFFLLMCGDQNVQEYSVVGLSYQLPLSYSRSL